jgi:hypothetical protein
MKNARYADGTVARFNGGLLSPVALVLFLAVVVAAMVSILSGYGLPQVAVLARARAVLVSAVMMLDFCGLVLTALLGLSERLRRVLAVLFGAALLGSGFVALVGWFAVSGASCCRL